MRTTRSAIKSALRLLWLRSRERSTALKLASYQCEECGIKQSTAKGKEVRLEVHHLEDAIDWNKMIDYLQRHLLCSPDNLEVLCQKCHYERHHGGKHEKH